MFTDKSKNTTRFSHCDAQLHVAILTVGISDLLLQLLVRKRRSMLVHGSAVRAEGQLILEVMSFGPMIGDISGLPIVTEGFSTDSVEDVKVDW